MSMSATTAAPPLTEHLAALDRRLHRAWKHRRPANCLPGTAGSGLTRAALIEPPHCREPDPVWSSDPPATLHAGGHDWISADTSGGAFADVAPGTYYHERCAHCGIYRTRHSRQGQPEGGTDSYYEYYPWGTAPPAGEVIDRNV